jgi:trans-aconitate methyltransferase
VGDADVHFDAFAQSYDDTLNAGLKISGEDSAFFAARRIEETRKAVARNAPSCGREKAIDFGCGTGNASGSLREAFGFGTVYGLDVSAASLAVAEKRFNDPGLRFQTIETYTPSKDVDLVFCNGVFHHIDPGTRPSSLAFVHAALKPGGVFVFWENNPWNPGVHYIMKAIPFDRDAKKILPHAAVRLLRRAGFKVLQLRFFFVFPKPLSFLRFLEPAMSFLPFGAQYQIVALKER